MNGAAGRAAALGRRVWAPALLVLIGMLAWGKALDGGFVYDDEAYVVKNEAIRSLSPLSKFFRADAQFPDPQKSRHVWRPATLFAFALDYRAAGLEPQVYHWTSVALHLFNALLVLWLMTLLLPSRVTAFAAAMVFLLHPVQVESVAWVSGMSNPLYLFFYLLALNCFVRWRQGRPSWNYALSILLFIPALLAKESAVTLPMVLGLMVWLRGKEESRRAAYLPILPHLLLALLYVAARSLVLGRTAQTAYWAGGLLPQMLTMAKGWLVYLRLAVVPHPLSLEYLFPVARGVDGEVLLAMGSLAALLWAGLHLRRKSPAASLDILLFLLALAPVSNLVPINTIVNERYLYLSIVGLGLVFAEGLSRLRLRAAVAAVAASGVLCGALTMARIPVWKDDLSLASASLKTCPQSTRLHYAMGKALAQRKQWGEAIREYRAALAVELYGDEALEVEPFSSAELAQAAEYRKSVQVKVDRPQALFNIGSSYLELGDANKAIGYLELAKRLAPDDAQIRNNLAVAYERFGEPEKAMAELTALLKDQPGEAKAEHNLRLFRGEALSAFVPGLKRQFPGLSEKWARLESLKYDETDKGISPFVGYLGSAQAAGALKPEERAALEAMAARDHGKAAAPPIFPKSFGGPYTVRLGDSAVEVRPLGATASEAKVQDGVILYPGPYQDTDIFLAASPHEVEEFYYLGSPAAPKEFRQELRPQGRIASFRVAADGDLEALDASGAALLRLSRPLVVDARGRRKEGKFRLEEASRVLGPADPVISSALETGQSRSGGGRTRYAAPRDSNRWNGRRLRAASGSHGSAGAEGGRGASSDRYGNGLFEGRLGMPAVGEVLVGLEHHDERFLEILPGFREGPALGVDAGNLLDEGDVPPALLGVNGGELAHHDFRSVAEARRDVNDGGVGKRRAYVLALSFEDRGLEYPVLIDPTWTTAGAPNMAAARDYHTATLLPNGKVLVAGGDCHTSQTPKSSLRDGQGLEDEHRSQTHDPD